MSYCPYCGAALMEGARFCSACGAAVAQAAVPTVQTAVNPVSALPSASVYSGEGYAVMLVDCGSCPAANVADLISDTCGYTDADAMRLATNPPTLIAQCLNESQAAYLAQSLTEYGAQAAVYDRLGNKTLLSDVDSVFDGAGSFLSKVASAFGLIGIGNRITNAIRRLTLPARPTIYTLPRPAPKPPVRRHTIRHPAPMPSLTPRRTAAPRQGHPPMDGKNAQPPMRSTQPHNGMNTHPGQHENGHSGPEKAMHRKP